MEVTPEALSNEMSLWTAGKEQQLTEKNSAFLPSVSVAEGVK